MEVSVPSLLRKTRNHYLVEDLLENLPIYLSSRTTKYPLYVLSFLLLVAAVGPAIAPYDYDQRHVDERGELQRLEGPSLNHPLGTTHLGYDVFSRLIIGARPTLIAGILGGMMIITIGMFVGITAGYMGGWIESFLMRLTDFVYGVPLIPFAIVLLALFGAGFYSSIAVIGLVIWRSSGRVLRAQVLQIRESEYIKAAEAMGSSPQRIIIKHILPNVMGMAILFFAIGIGVAIVYQASLAFLGMSNPFIPSWGVMLRNAYDSGYMGRAWWWSVPPGIMISVTVLCTLLLGRGVEVFDEEKYV